MLNIPHFYALPLDQALHMERLINQVVFIVCAGEPRKVEALAREARALAVITSNLLFNDIAAIMIDAITPDWDDISDTAGDYEL